MSRRCAVVVLALASLISGCGQAEEAPPRSVSFAAAGGTRLEGKLFGGGSVGVVMSHMGRPGDTQADWYSLARTLAEQGYLALTYNRRGVCPRHGNGCSQGADLLEESWRDVVGAARFLRERGATRIVLVGASIGAMSSVHAAARGGVDAAAIVEIGGVNHASGYDFSRADLRRLKGAKLFVSAEGDVYGGDDAAREWFAWARAPKRLLLLPGSDHGTDMLRADAAMKERLTTAIVEFLAGAV